MSHFNEAVAEVLKAEGGLLIDPGEGGGGANFGITLTTLRTFRNDQGLTLVDLENLKKDEAELIYKALYWDKLGLDAITGRLSAIVIMDQAVNRGVGGVKTLLRECLNRRYGKQLPAGANFSDMLPLVNEIEDRSFFRRFVADAQLAYVEIATANPTKQKWLRGWLVRTHNLLKLLI